MRHLAPATKRAWVYGLAALLLSGPAVPIAQVDPVVVIVNKNNTQPINRLLVVYIYTGVVRAWPDGTPAVAVDQRTGSATHTDFYKRIIGKSHAAMRALWAQNIFAGKSLPPKVLPTDLHVRELVGARENAIGYIRASQVDDSVRVVDR